jgi:type IV pilus assembly protein PilV
MNGFYGIISQKSRQTGFSLLEVLIAIVVTSIGLLGLAGMQATGLRNNHSAYHRSQATVLAYDIADRMRSNASSMVSYITPVEVETLVAGCKTTGGCTAAQLAQNDVTEWNADLATALSGGAGSIALAGGIFTISVNWDDNRDGLVNANDPGLQVSFQP